MQQPPTPGQCTISWNHGLPAEIRTLIWHMYLRDYFNSPRFSKNFSSIFNYLTINKDITSIILSYLRAQEAYVRASKVRSFLEFAGPIYRPRLRINVIWDLSHGIERTNTVQKLLSNILRVGYLQRIEASIDGDFWFTPRGRSSNFSHVPNFTHHEGITTPYKEGSRFGYEDLLFTSLDGIVPYVPDVTQYGGLQGYRGPILFFKPLEQFKMIGSMTIPGLGGYLGTPAAHGLKIFDFYGPSYAHDCPGLCFTCILLLLSQYCPQLEFIRLRTDDRQISASSCYPRSGEWRSAANLKRLDIMPSVNVLTLLVDILASPRLKDVFLDFRAFEIGMEYVQPLIESWTRDFPLIVKIFKYNPDSCRIMLPIQPPM
ncbi:hypothetical protein TWF192_005732 [Orbilia oligospora]|uniref:Uncharacterized protein n=1 Tax=Orbilia oligospora TaxID=2813651 RepID=A0A6G1MLY8_ORBOL|nr:hypothetical protein TWF191_003907 [Orbilia oligospora]KAF3263451.1 hypothetical protein TWF192_005732 [Orbilia oligospora]